MTVESKSIIELKKELSELHQQIAELEQQLKSTKNSDPDNQYKALFSIFYHAPYAVIVADAQSCLFINAAGMAITGYSLEDVPTVEACFETFFPDREYQQFVRKQWLIDLNPDEKHRKQEFHVTCKNGIVKTLEFSIFAVKKNMLFVIFTDITRKKQEYDALIASEARYRAIFESSGTALIILDADYTILSANHKFAALSGYSRAEIELKKNWTEFVFSEDQRRMSEYQQFNRDESTETVHNFEFRFIDRNRNIRFIVATITPIPDTSRYVASLLDLTDRKQAEKEQKSLIAELQKELAGLRTMSGLLPICAFCKKVRDDQGHWKQVEAYIEERSSVRFTHSICPDCGKKLYSTYQIDKE